MMAMTMTDAATATSTTASGVRLLTDVSLGWA